MSFHRVLGRYLLALLLLAGIAAAAGLPGTARAATTAAEVSQQPTSVKARLQQDDEGGRAALDPAWGDADDDAKAFLFTPAGAAPAPCREPPAAIGAAFRTTPLSHWPCAGTPTGPPRS